MAVTCSDVVGSPLTRLAKSNKKEGDCNCSPSTEAKDAINRSSTIFKSGNFKQTSTGDQKYAANVSGYTMGKFGTSTSMNMNKASRQNTPSSDNNLNSFINIENKQSAILTSMEVLIRGQTDELQEIAKNTRITYEKIQDVLDDFGQIMAMQGGAINRNQFSPPQQNTKTANQRSLGLFGGLLGGLIGSIIGGLFGGLARALGAIGSGALGALGLGARGGAGGGRGAARTPAAAAVATAKRTAGNRGWASRLGGLLRGGGRASSGLLRGGLLAGRIGAGLLGGPVGIILTVISLISLFPETFKAIANGIVDTFESVATKLSSAYDAVKETITASYDWIARKAGEIFGVLSDKFTEWYNGIRRLLGLGDSTPTSQARNVGSVPGDPYIETESDIARARSSSIGSRGGSSARANAVIAGAYGDSPAPTGARAERERAIREGLIARGLSPEEASGATANAMHESLGDPSRVNANDNGKPAYGLFQWRDTRAEEYKRVNGHYPNEGNLNEQLDFFMRERNGSEQRNIRNARLVRESTGTAGRDLTPEDWAHIYGRGFERFNERTNPNEMGRRMATARGVHDRGSVIPPETAQPVVASAVPPGTAWYNTPENAAVLAPFMVPEPIRTPLSGALLDRLRQEQQTAQTETNTAPIIIAPQSAPQQQMPQSAPQQQSSNIPSVRNDDPIILRAITEDLVMVG